MGGRLNKFDRAEVTGKIQAMRQSILNRSGVDRD